MKIKLNTLLFLLLSLFINSYMCQIKSIWDKDFKVIESDPKNTDMETKLGRYHLLNISKQEQFEYKFKMNNFDPDFIGKHDSVHYELNEDYFYQEKQNISMKGEILHSLKLKNNFSEIEIEIIENECLSLFFFVDSTPETTLIVDQDKFEVIIQNEFIDLNDELNNINILDNKKFQIVSNNLDQEYIYLKGFCPFYSTFLSKSVIYDLQQIPSEIAKSKSQ